MNSKIWFSICFFFMIFNLKILIDDYYLVNYLINEDRNLTNDFTNYLICFNTRYAKVLGENYLWPNFKPKISEVPIEQFLNYTILILENYFKFNNFFKLNQTFMFDNNFCFRTDTKQLNDTEYLNNFLKFLNSPERKKFIGFSMSNHPIFENAFMFDKGNIFNNFVFQKQKIYDEKYLSNYDCLNNEHNYKGRSFKLNECLKGFNQSKYGLYDKNDNVKFNLSLIINTNNKLGFKEKEIQHKKKLEYLYSNAIEETVDENLYNFFIKNCSNKYSNNDCFYETFRVFHLKSERSDKKIDMRSTIFRAYYSTTDFSLQFIGILCLFTNTSLIDTLPRLITKLAKKLKIDRHRFFRLNFPKFKFTLVIFSLILVIEQSILMYKDFKFKSNFPNKTNILNFSDQLPSFVVCFPIEILISADGNILKGRNSKFLKENTFNKLVEKTNWITKFDKLFKNIDLIYGNRKKDEFDLELTNKILFYYGNYKVRSGRNFECLSRCFKFSIKLKKQLRYEKLTPIYFLNFTFFTPLFNLFLIDKDQEFSNNLTVIDQSFVIRKSKIEKSSFNLIDNKNEKLDCLTKQECIRKCINNKYFNKYSSLPMHSLIDKDELKLFMLHKIKFSDKRDYEIEINCKEQFKNYYFNERLIKYERKVGHKDNLKNIVIYLNIENIVEIELEQSIIKLILNILNLESILFGSNATILLVSIFSVIKRTFKLRWYKSFDYIILLICSIGFSVHIYLVFDGLIKENLINNSYFKRLENYSLPTILICNDIKEKIDANFLLTGSYLENLTSDQINFNNTFYKLRYFNKTHIKSLNLNNYLNPNSEISIKTIYYLSFKCFQISLMIEFNEDDYYFLPDYKLLEVIFRSTLGNKFHIFYMYKNTTQTSGVYEFVVEEGIRKKDFKSFRIDFDYFEIEREDKFEIFKNPLSLLYDKSNLNDANKYMSEMKLNFNKINNLTTRNIILNNDQFKQEIDDNLFKQYYLQVQEVKDNKYPTSLNTKQDLFKIFSSNYTDDYPALIFRTLPISRMLEIINNENWAKLVQNLMNVLSLWMGICILDLYNYVNYVLNLIPKFYNFLIEIQIKLNNSLLQMNSCTILFN